jgi:hypothetical protein
MRSFSKGKDIMEHDGKIGAALKEQHWNNPGG